MKKGTVNMKKVYRLQDLDCANCAAKMERAIAKIDGVDSVTVSFMAQKLTLECDEARLAEILEKVKACIAKVEPDTKLLGA